MSRRKQENPQPRKRIINAETELLQDTLTCGSCQKIFVLSEIVKFIQHKVHSCNKENNFIILEDGGQPPNYDSDREDPIGSLVAASRPSISAPICNRKGLHHQHHHLHRNRNRTEKLPSPAKFNENQEEGEVCKKEFDEVEDKKKIPKEEPVVKQEVKDPSLRASPKIMVNAYTNTIITEPSTYTCSTCKQTFTSAWVLVQHAQHMHGMKIYLVTPYSSGGRNSTPASTAPVLPPAVPPLGLPLPPVPIPPCTMNGPTHPHHHGVLPQQPLALENHPALQLLRMPLGERQFAPGLFPRPSSQDFRVDALATSSSSAGEFRLNHHPPPPPPHSAAAAALGFDSWRPPPLGFEPQMDFYSQRLRQLAGATSPTTASPRKLTPPQQPPPPPPSSSSQPSTPQPALNLAQPSSASSTSSKGTPGSPKTWACDFCSKSFRFQSNLIVHRRSHTGEKPYRCPICRHACSQASKLKRHMKTHRENGNNGKAEESPRSTPDSTSERRQLEEEEDGSDGQTADNEEEDEEDELDEEEPDEEDLEDSSDVMMAEDLSTRTKSKDNGGDMTNSSETVSASNGEVAVTKRHSLLGEVMDKIGLSNIQQYNEAYQKALEESGSLKNSRSPHKEENGPREETKPLGFFGALEYAPHNNSTFNAFESSKRLKTDEPSRDSLYAGLWLPSVHRDPYGDKSSDSALNKPLSPRPGTSGMLMAKGPPVKEQRRNDTCEYCGKVFKNCSNLTVHRRSHTGEKPYKCELCSYACAQSSKLTRHMKTHGRLGKDVYRCRFCDMPFSVPSTLEKHMRKCVVNQNATGVTYMDRDSDSKELT